MPFSDATSTNPAASPTTSTPSPWRRSGQRVVAALGDRLRAPLHHLAALEVGAEERVQLQPLQQHVRRRASRLLVVEADHEAEGHAGSAPSDSRSCRRRRRVGSGQPSVWIDRVQRLLRLPELLDAERVDLRVVASRPPATRARPGASEPRVPSDSTVTLRRDVGRRREAAAGLAVALEARRRRCARRARGRPRRAATSAGKPVNMLTPSASAFSPSQRTISQSEAT